MKKLIYLFFILFVARSAQATPVTSSVITIASPKLGQAPSVNRFAVSATPFYRISWRTVTVDGNTVNYLTSFTYSGSQLLTADSVYGATTYAEIQAKVAALGMTNLPADPNAGH